VPGDSKSALDYPFANPPAPGSVTEVAPGVRWMRMPLPFELDHINLWLLDDEHEGKPALTLADTGLGNDATRALHERVFSAESGGRRLWRQIVTHYHPDHAGNASWMRERHGAELWMTRAEYLTVHAARGGVAGYSTQGQIELFRTHGLDEASGKVLLGRGDLYRKLVPDFPLAHRRMLEGDRIRINGNEWRVMIGYGHAPEHASLYSEALNVLIAGDMLLPRISTNVAVRPVDPQSNPLRLFLESIARYRALPQDVLVLPSHGLPFRGAHARVAALEAHHEARLGELVTACATAPKSAFEVLEVLFRRKLDTNAIFFAMGEAIAHLHCLYYDGRLQRNIGADGVARFAAKGN
jgi:glyoxylase-like metal-dependent hydrolase (beta-lactamase superfamily II)